jgi:hypothetical protein
VGVVSWQENRLWARLGIFSGKFLQPHWEISLFPIPPLEEKTKSPLLPDFEVFEEVNFK